MKFHNVHLPSFHLPCFGKPATQETENKRNQPAQEASPPPGFRPEKTNPHRHFLSPLQKLFPRKKKPGAFAHADPFAPNRQDNSSAAAPIRRPNFIPFNPAQEIATVEKKIVSGIKDSLSHSDKNILSTSRFHYIRQHYINHGLHEIDQKFGHALKNILPGQSRKKLERARAQAKMRIMQSANDACRSAGWELPLRERSNLAWESPEGPLLLKRGLSLQQLKLNKANIASGSFGSVSIFENENGDQLIGKISKNNMRDGRGVVIDDLGNEMQAYKIIYNAVGPHPNLVNAYGIAQVPNNREMKRTLLMDAIPGPTGEKTFDALRKCWDAGKISSEEYWGAMQFVGRRLLDVTEHISAAGIVHNDIKPENFLVNENTGEPVLIDLGVWSPRGAKNFSGTPDFMSPEAKYGHGVSQRSDVFTVGASLLEGIEKGERKPNQGLLKRHAFRDHEGNVTHQPGTYSADTAYTRFMNSILAQNRDFRVTAQGAKNLDFLNDSMLDDHASKEVIKKAISLANEEKQTPENEQWKKAEPQLYVSPARGEFTQMAINALMQNPNLHDYAKLRNASNTDPALKRYLDGNALDHLQGHIEVNMAERADDFLTSASWFHDVKRITNGVPQTIKSGVDKNGVRLATADKNIDQNYARSVMQAGRNLASLTNIEDLRSYADNAEEFLRDAGTLKKINDDRKKQQVEQVHERAVVARRMVEIFETDLSLSTEPKEGNVQERVLAFELERQLKRRK